MYFQSETMAYSACNYSTYIYFSNNLYIPLLLFPVFTSKEHSPLLQGIYILGYGGGVTEHWQVVEFLYMSRVQSLTAIP